MSVHPEFELRSRVSTPKKALPALKLDNISRQTNLLRDRSKSPMDKSIRERYGVEIPQDVQTQKLKEESKMSPSGSLTSLIKSKSFKMTRAMSKKIFVNKEEDVGLSRWNTLRQSVTGVSSFRSPSSDAAVAQHAQEAEKINEQVEHYRRLAHSVGRQERFVVDPGGIFIQRWDEFITLLVFFTLLVMPFEIAFLDVNSQSFVLTAANRLVDAGFIFDIGINFCLGFYDSDHLYVTRHSRIIRRYLSTHFFVDFVSVVPFEFLCEQLTSDELSETTRRFVRLGRLIKLARLVRMFRVIGRLRGRLMLSDAKFSLSLFLIVVMSTLHWSACLWRLVPVLEDDSQPTWTSEFAVDELPTVQQYIICFEFALQAMVLSYGTIHPTTAIERFVALILMIAAGGLYAYMIAAVCSTISNIDPADKAFRQTSDLLKLYCIDVGAPKEMQREVNEYYMQCANVSLYRFYRQALGELSPQIQGRVAYFAYNDIVSSIDFFRTSNKDEERDFFRAVALHLQPIVFCKKECVYAQGSTAKALYIVQRGMASSDARLLCRGGYFGVDSVLLRTYKPKHQRSVHSLSYLHCFTLARLALRRIFDQGNCNSIRHAVNMFARRRSMCQLVRHVSLLFRVVWNADPRFDSIEQATAARHAAIRSYKKTCTAVAERYRAIARLKQMPQARSRLSPKGSSEDVHIFNARRDIGTHSFNAPSIMVIAKAKRMAKKIRKKMDGMSDSLMAANAAGLLRLRSFHPTDGEHMDIQIENNGSHKWDYDAMVKQAKKRLAFFATPTKADRQHFPIRRVGESGSVAAEVNTAAAAQSSCEVPPPDYQGLSNRVEDISQSVMNVTQLLKTVVTRLDRMSDQMDLSLDV